MEEPIQ